MMRKYYEIRDNKTKEVGKKKASPFMGDLREGQSVHGLLFC